MYFRFPSREVLYTNLIYCSILIQHFKNQANKFNNTVFGDLIVRLTINFRDKTISVFVPNSIKFQYVCDLRDIEKVKSSRIIY